MVQKFKTRYKYRYASWEALCNTQKQLCFADSINADMCMDHEAMWIHVAIDHVCVHAAVAARMHQRNTTCQRNTHAKKRFIFATPHVERKGMYKEKPHYMSIDMYNYKAKTHQTSSPTILSTAVKAVRGAVVALGVCIHNTALSTDCTTTFMNPTGDCAREYECIYCCWVLMVSSLNATLRLHAASNFRHPKMTWCWSEN